jgi:2-polyprenyl-3-methyl-5-hydroxy-6-metoxy-1,4-benzoquinol methylase
MYSSKNKSAVKCLLCTSDVSDVQVETFDYSYETSHEAFWYALCKRCSSWIQLTPPVQMFNYYPSNYGNPRSKKRRVMRRLKSQKQRSVLRGIKSQVVGTRLLDFGCGDSQLLADARRVGFEIFGTDFDPRLQSNCEKVGGFWIKPDQLSSYRGTFDVITMLQSVEHVPNPSDELLFLKSLLRPGGVVLIETPSPDGPDFGLFERAYWGGFHAPRHYFVPSFVGLALLVTSVGLEVIEHRFIPSPYTWAETLRARMRHNMVLKSLSRFISLDNPIYLIAITLYEYSRLIAGGRTSNQRLIARLSASGESISV